MTDELFVINEDPDLTDSKIHVESICIDGIQPPSVNEILPTDTAAAGNYKNYLTTINFRIYWHFTKLRLKISYLLHFINVVIIVSFNVIPTNNITYCKYIEYYILLSLYY